MDLTKLLPSEIYTQLIKLAVGIILVAAPIMYHKHVVADLEEKLDTSQKSLYALQAANGVQNAEITRLSKLNSEYKGLLDVAVEKNATERRASEKLIRDIMGRDIPKDCTGAMNSLQDFFNGKAKEWNKR